MIQLKCPPSPFILSLLCLCLFGCGKPETPEPVKAPTEPVLTAAPVKGKSFSIPDINLDMLWCKPGTFQMGSPEDEKDREDNETLHEVTLTQGFYLGKYEVTQEQWEKVLATNPSEYGHRYTHHKTNLPVEKVSWDDAMGFCKELTQREKAAGRLPEGWSYTLPTEAQWEYACRAGTKTAYSFGDTITLKQANYGVEFHTRPVGSYPPTPWGFHDLHGNVWEWCSDWWGDYPNGSASDPVGPSDGSLRVLRGGGWVNFGGSVRSAIRFRHTPDGRHNYLGFRLSLQTEKKERSDP